MLGMLHRSGQRQVAGTSSCIGTTHATLPQLPLVCHLADKPKRDDARFQSWGLTRRPWFHSQWAILWHWMD